MPLPDEGAGAWPPEHLAPVYAKYAEWSAWHSGDTDQLMAIYTGAQSEAIRQTVFGRIISAVKRWFWGNEASAARPRQRVHVPLAGDIASTSADLLFSEPPQIRVDVDEDTEEADPTQERLDALIDAGAHAALLEAAEVCAALGGVYARIVWDKTVDPERPWIAPVHPDAAVPEWKYGRLTAVTFWRVILIEGQRVVRHLERHEPGKIIHRVYEGGFAEIGYIAPLTDYAETEGLAAELTDGDTIATGFDGLTAVYVPNMRPNRIWRSVPDAAALGASDFSGVEGLMDALDLTCSSLVRDVELGKARLVVPADYLQNLGRGQGAEFDLDRELYEGVNFTGEDKSGTDITQVQFPIRVAEHRETMSQLKRDIVSSAGYSAATFGLTDGNGAPITATEVNADQRKSFITRDRKTRYWTTALSMLIEALLAVDKAQFGSDVVPQRPQIDWPAAVSVDPEAQARKLALWKNATAASIETMVRDTHPDWDKTQIDDEVERIREENNIGQAEDPGTFTGGSFGNEPTVGEAPTVDEGEEPGDEA